MRLRILVLPLAAAVIAGLVWHKHNQVHRRQPATANGKIARIQAPPIEAIDAENSITRLKSFLGRHSLLVVFFDGQTGADADKTLNHLKQHSAELKAADYHVIAVSSALPQQNRKTDFPPLFHLLTAPAPVWKVHRNWCKLLSTRSEAPYVYTERARFARKLARSQPQAAPPQIRITIPGDEEGTVDFQYHLVWDEIIFFGQ